MLNWKKGLYSRTEVDPNVILFCQEIRADGEVLKF